MGYASDQIRTVLDESDHIEMTPREIQQRTDLTMEQTLSAIKNMNDVKRDTDRGAVYFIEDEPESEIPYNDDGF